MREQLEQKLYDVFSEFFYDKDNDCYLSISCGDGWFDLIYRMCIDIEEFMNQYSKDEFFRFTQIKEKYGGLRVYFICSCDESSLDDIIAEAEDESDKTCEQCGREGENRDIGGWYKTLCGFCFEQTFKRDE